MTTMSEYCKNIHSNPDAQAWAKFFIETLKEQGWKIEHIDEGLMIGWFANAMMAMHDHVKREWVGLTDEDEEQYRIDADASYRRHMSSIRGQMISPADNYDWHLIKAVLAKAKEKNT